MNIYAPETILFIRETELTVLWYEDDDDKWGITNAEMVQHINEFLPGMFREGLMVSTVNMDKAFDCYDHDTVLAYVYAFTLRELILSYAKTRVSNLHDGQMLGVSHDITFINLQKLEARLLEIREDKPVAATWRQ